MHRALGMTPYRFGGVLFGSALGLGIAACQQEGIGSPSKTSSDVTTTSAIVAGPPAPCSRGEVRAWNNGESICVRSCDSAGGCPDARVARRCGANEMLAGAPDSTVDYCVERR
jgi:hypothetical protein